MSGIGWLATKLGIVAPPDPEEERARERNAMREFGKKLQEERDQKTAEREREQQVYLQMLTRSKGNAHSAYGKQALQAKRNIVLCDQAIAAIDSRLNPIKQVLTTVAQRQMDQEFAQLMRGVMTAEKLAPAGCTRDELNSLMGEAGTMVKDTQGLERDLNSLDMGVVEDVTAVDHEFAADFAALNAPGAITRSTAAQAASTITEEATAAAVANAVRAGMTWTPPANVYGV